MKPSSRHSILWAALFLLILSFSIGIHSYRLTEIPHGFYADEVSIGLNAATIATSLKDEHGVFLPSFFEAFGEYKNPLYIYATSLLFYLFGPSLVLLRLTSILFFLLFQVGLLFLTEHIFKKKYITVLSLLLSSTLPYFFPISRISFELISMLSTTIWALYFLYRSSDKTSSLLFPILSGVLFGSTLYSYSTARFLVPLWTLCSCLFLFKTTSKKVVLAFFCGSFVASIPFLLFQYLHPGLLTIRFYIISYWADESLSVVQKISLLVHNYLSYFSPDFLLLSGDPMLRHHTGHGGVIFWSMAILVIMGLYSYLRHTKTESTWWHLMFIFLLSSPLAAAMTNEPYHLLRSHVFGIFLLLFALYGVSKLCSSMHKKTTIILSVALLSLFVLESSAYLSHYFTRYQITSIEAFQNAGFEESIQEVLHVHPDTLYIISQNPDIRTYLDFYHVIFPDLKKIPTYINPMGTTTPHSCTIFPKRGNERIFQSKCL